VITGLGVAYAAHRKGKPISFRNALQPLLGDRVEGRIGDLIDLVATVITLFGLGSALGLGVLQAASGLDFLGIGADNTVGYIIIITAIIVATTISVLTGVSKGMKWLTNIN